MRVQIGRYRKYRQQSADSYRITNLFYRVREIRRYARRGGLYGVSKTIVCREGEKGVWGVMEFNRVRRAEHAGSYMARGLRRRLPLRHVSHKEGKESTKGVSGKREPRPVK